MIGARGKLRSLCGMVPLLAICVPMVAMRATVVAQVQTVGPLVVVACTSDGSTVAFPLLQGTPPIVREPMSADAVLDMGEPARAVACQAVVENTGAADPFKDDTGTLTLAVNGPAQIVENGFQVAMVDCGCGGVVGDGATVTALPSLTFHVAQQPGTPLPSGPTPGAIHVIASFQPADGSAGAVGSAAIDLVPPVVHLNLSAQPVMSVNGDYGTVQLTLHIERVLPADCSPIDDAAFIVCALPVSSIEEAGAEAGMVAFSTSLGTFANGAQQFQALCGEQPVITPTVPYPGLPSPGTQGCDTLTVSIALQGHAGDATFTADYSGAYTGAHATARVTVPIAPLPPSYRLLPGCTQVSAPLELPASAPVRLIAESVTPPDAVTGIWRLGAEGVWQLGYAPDANTPVDFTIVSPGDSLFICVDLLADYPLH